MLNIVCTYYNSASAYNVVFAENCPEEFENPEDSTDGKIVAVFATHDPEAKLTVGDDLFVALKNHLDL